MFQLVRELRDRIDREAFGSFVLSMTRSVNDILGAYLLAKVAGLFAEPAGVETSPSRSFPCSRPSTICSVRRRS